MAKHTKEQLKQLQALPLSAKVEATKRRIIEWYEHWEGQVYVSFSGGKDSTVLLHIVRELYPDVEAVFVDTGLEFPEIRQFVKTFENVTILRPNMRFDEVIKTYGYPLISKEVSDCVQGARKGQKCRTERINGTGKYENSLYAYPKFKPLLDVDYNISPYCCNKMKKEPTKQFEKSNGKKPILAMLATESKLRRQGWLRTGCNAYEGTRVGSNPMAFWTEQDVLQYIKDNNIEIASVYGKIEYENEPEQIRWSDINAEYAKFESKETRKLRTTGAERTGCIFCAFGAHLEKEPTRFQRIKETHPRQYEYCIGGGCYDEKGNWIPNKEGLGMGHVFDELNKIYGEDFIKYK